MKKIMLLVLSFGLCGSAAWAKCTSFENAEKVLKSIDPNFQSGKAYTVAAKTGKFAGTSIPIAVTNNGGEAMIGSAVACIKGGGGRAQISFQDVQISIVKKSVTYVQGGEKGTATIQF
jgi:hypothetical protein